MICMTKRALAVAFGSTTLVAALAISPLLSYGAVNQTNQNTGANSKNRNRVRHEQSFTAIQTNLGVAVNNLGANVNTGGNKAKKNTTAGSITSGAINGTVTIANSLNQSSTPLPTPSPAPVDVTQTNDTTGADSVNKNKVTIKQNHTVVSTNTAVAVNNVGLNANTGDNTASKNTEAGDITSGDVTFSFGVTNTLN